MCVRLPSGSNFQHCETLNLQLDHVLVDRSTLPIHLIGRPDSTRSAVVLKLLIEINNDNLSFYFARFVYNGALSRQSAEHIETILNVLLLMLIDDSKDTLSFELSDEFTDNELNVVEFLPGVQKSSICQQLKSNEQLKKELFNMASKSQFYPINSMKLLTVLSRLEVSETSVEALQELLQMCENQPDDYRNCVIKLIGSHIKVTDSASEWNDELINSVLTCLHDAANPDSLDNLRYVELSSYSNITAFNGIPLYFRVSAAVCANHLPASIMLKHKEDQSQFLTYTDLILVLLRDDHYLVRDHATRRVMEITKWNDSAKTQTLPISSRAEEIFLNWIEAEIQSFDTALKMKLWQALFERQLDLEFDTSDVMEVFKKNEANLFGERLLTARLVYQKLMQCAGDEAVITLPLAFSAVNMFFNENCVV